ncbi:MAG: CAP domain-containing protein [Bacteroidota bacterium]|nr:CAP domain-containing protein [Bacteroidota bacterium]
MFHVKQRKSTILLFVLIALPFLAFSQAMNQVWLEKKEVLLSIPKDERIENWDKQNHRLYAQLSKDGKEWLYWINYSRQNPQSFWANVITPYLRAYPILSKGGYALSLKRTLFKMQPLPLLTLDGRLIHTAQAHATDISEHNISPSHTSSNGDSFADRMNKAGIGAAAENISVGNHAVVLSLILLYLDLDIPSLGHRKNLLNPSYTKIGIGTSFLSDGSLFTVQDFAKY